MPLSWPPPSTVAACPFPLRLKWTPNALPPCPSVPLQGSRGFKHCASPGLLPSPSFPFPCLVGGPAPDCTAPHCMGSIPFPSARSHNQILVLFCALFLNALFSLLPPSLPPSFARLRLESCDWSTILTYLSLSRQHQPQEVAHPVRSLNSCQLSLALSASASAFAPPWASQPASPLAARPQFQVGTGPSKPLKVSVPCQIVQACTRKDLTTSA